MNVIEYVCGFPINRNMRCIEIDKQTQWTPEAAPINRNMRCIEIIYCRACILSGLLINRNMRCIEIQIQLALCHSHFRLIET